MLGFSTLYLCALSVSFTINGGLIGQVQLESSYSGSRTVKLGSSFDFSWNYTGNLSRVEWGTKERGKNALAVTLFILDVNGRLTPNISQYNGRRFGYWNQQSPGQVRFTLNPIKVVDNQVFIFKFVPENFLAPELFEIVQLIVEGDAFVVGVIPPALSILRGVKASLTCNAEGFPLPNIVWMKQTDLGESEIHASNVNVQINTHNGSSQLVVKNASTADSGYYTCKASNYVSDTARAFLGVVSSYEDHDLCPTSFDATRGESVLICCPVQGFPPPQVSWELPNGTLLETGSTILHVIVKTENDFGRYRCIARSLEKNVRTANITIRERSSYPHIIDKKIILKDGDKLAWKEVPGASYYLLRLPGNKLLEDNSLLGCNTSTSVEIPYSSLTFKRGIKKKPSKVKTEVEVWAFGKSRIIGNGTRYTDVEIYASAAASTVSLMTLLLSFVIYNVQ
nr:hemicentin-2-like isoform X2 [Pocillopora verrucosa]